MLTDNTALYMYQKKDTLDCCHHDSKDMLHGCWLKNIGSYTFARATLRRTCTDLRTLNKFTASSAVWNRKSLIV